MKKRPGPPKQNGEPPTVELPQDCEFEATLIITTRKDPFRGEKLCPVMAGLGSYRTIRAILPLGNSSLFAVASKRIDLGEVACTYIITAYVEARQRQT